MFPVGFPFLALSWALGPAIASGLVQVLRNFSKPPQPVSLVGQAAKICRALQFTNQANFDKRFCTKFLETYKIHNSIRKNILSNFVSVELEPGERLGSDLQGD